MVLQGGGVGIGCGSYRAGALLLFGDVLSPPSERPKVNPVEGIRWTYRAATNSHIGACINMSRALQRGLGVKTNFVQAYAWLHMFAYDKGNQVRPTMNLLALKLQTEEIEEAQVLAREFRNHLWPPLVVVEEPVPEVSDVAAPVELALKVSGIAVGGKHSLATINRITLEEGESAKVPITGGTVAIQCLKISEDSVLVQVKGESEPRMLTLN